MCRTGWLGWRRACGLWSAGWSLSRCLGGRRSMCRSFSGRGCMRGCLSGGRCICRSLSGRRCICRSLGRRGRWISGVRSAFLASCSLWPVADLQFVVKVEDGWASLVVSLNGAAGSVSAVVERTTIIWIRIQISISMSVTSNHAMEFTSRVPRAVVTSASRQVGPFTLKSRCIEKKVGWAVVQISVSIGALVESGAVLAIWVNSICEVTAVELCALN